MNNMSYIETSALDSTNVETAFNNLISGNFGFILFVIKFFLCLFF